jgi:CubicO group peptidase (beta-lactamase class C family)
MNFEDFQKSWQSQDGDKRISIKADVLLSEVRRNQQQFHHTILRRDLIEVGVAAVLVPIFTYWGWKGQWTSYLVAFACFVVGAYFLVNRWRQRKKTPDLHGSLKDCATTSLAEVNHQIYLLKNVLWWYLLPIYVPIVMFFGETAWRKGGPVGANIIAALTTVFMVGFTTVTYAGIYWLNQRAVKKNLEPRRRELEKLLEELESEKKRIDMKTKKPLGPLLLVLAACITAAIARAAMKTNSIDNIAPATSIEAIRKAHNLPALAVVVTKDGRICDRAAAGIRKWDDPTPVTTNDVFHIGSCTKSMTATLAAMFIEQGKLRWDTTIAEVFPELKGKMDKQYETVTVEQLLHQRGGVPHEPPPAAWSRAWQEIGTPTEQRREFIEAVLSAPPAAAPGTKEIYSNQGYAIVGAMLEKISGQDFESMMTEKLFKPLHMDTAGFGPPGTKDKTDQPWGHLRKLFVALPGQTDNPPAISPAGRVHCSLDDLARYAMFHLQENATNGLLKSETLARLHKPDGTNISSPIENYACGWVVLQRGWAGGRTLWHNGSNTMWYIVMWLAPEKNFSVIVATNIAGDDAEKACDEMAVSMIQKWLPEK